MNNWKKKISIISLISLSVVAWFITYLHHLVTAYNDAMSHLDIPRLVVDDIQPGIAQLGGVWLPLNHILSLPLIWNDWAWHSGFAGSIVSMTAYVLSVIGIYKIIFELTSHKLGARIGAAAFALNLNILYLQATPLTEPLFLALVIASSLYLIRYIRTHEPKFLVLVAIFTALQILARYDGWFIAGIEAIIILITELKIYKMPFKKSWGNLILFLAPVVSAVFLWLLWNLVLYGNPLYSFIGPYSAHAQQALIQTKSGLITKGNLLISTKAFGLDVNDNIGILVLAGGVLGWMFFLIRSRITNTVVRSLIFALFVSDIVFNIVALFIGFSIINVPGLHWNPTNQVSGDLFNVRYGITALPFVAVGFGLLASKMKRLAPILLLIIVLQGALILHGGIITIKDGTEGTSAFTDQDIALVLKKDVNKNDKVIMSSSSFNGVMFESGLNLSQFIHEGVSTEWKDAIANPSRYAKWIVMANGNVGDPVYTSLVVKERDAFLKSYSLIYRGKHANIYEEKTTFQRYITASNNHLYVGNQKFIANVFNDYNLAYTTNTNIDYTLSMLHKSHINTVRFWMFGDGIANGFQPKPGIINITMLEKTDYIIAEANRYQIRLIPTLVSSSEDYGGINQYVQWVGLPTSDSNEFFTDSQIITLYENYINHVLTHVDPLTKVAYKDDSSILAWDVISESSNDQVTSSLMAPWDNTISTYITKIDANHIIMISLGDPQPAYEGNNPLPIQQSFQIPSPAYSFLSSSRNNFYILDNTNSASN